MSDHWKSIGEILGTPNIPESPAPEEPKPDDLTSPQPESEKVDDSQEIAEEDVPELVPVTRDNASTGDSADEGSDEDNPTVEWDFEGKKYDVLSEVLGIETPSKTEEEPEAEPQPNAWDNLVASFGITEETSSEQPQPSISPIASKPKAEKTKKNIEPPNSSSFGAGLGIEPEEPQETEAASEAEVFDEVEVIDEADLPLEPGFEEAEERSETRGRRRRGRRRPESKEPQQEPTVDPLGFTSFNDIEDDDEPEATAIAEPGESDDEAPTDERPRRRRGRRGGRRRGRRGESAEEVEVANDDEDTNRQDAVSSFDDDHEDDEEAAELRGNRRRRRGRRRGGDRGDVREDTVETNEKEREPRRRSRRSDSDDQEENRSRNQNIPSWLETVELLVKPNLDSRNKGNKPKGRGGRGRSRRRNDD